MLYYVNDFEDWHAGGNLLFIILSYFNVFWLSDMNFFQQIAYYLYSTLIAC